MDDGRATTDGRPQTAAADLREVILALARRYDFEEGHSLQDERLALRLFDETARLVHLG